MQKRLYRTVEGKMIAGVCGGIAEYFNIGEFNHHRASDDARVLAEVFFVMQTRLKSEGVFNFTDMVEAMSEKTDPLKLPCHHMVIFAQNKEIGRAHV